MKKYLKQTAVVLFIALVFFVLLVVVTRGQVASGGQFSLQKRVIAGGGNEKQSAGSGEHGTTGQAVAGHHSFGAQFSLVSGCWTPDTVFPPTAASVTISGRVTTSQGRGITRVRVTLMSSTGETRAVMTSTFGYYRFAAVESGEYFVSVSARNFTFSEPAVMVSATDNVAGVTFIANPR